MKKWNESESAEGSAIRFLDCENEEIFIPWAVQAFGCVLIFDERGIVRYGSENCALWLGRSVSSLIGCRVAELWSAEENEKLMRCASMKKNCYYFELTWRHTGGEKSRFYSRIHKSAGCYVLELEPAESEWDGADGFVRGAAPEALLNIPNSLEEIEGLEPFYAAVAREIRGITGYDRVTVYRWDAEGRCAAVAEEKREDWDVDSDRADPAVDIPFRDRGSYHNHFIRIIHDVLCDPAPLFPQRGAVEIAGGGNGGIGEKSAEVDLGFAIVRGGSPVHMRRLRTMGVRAAMALSLVVQGEVRGLIVCYHSTPKLLPIPQRLTCEILARTISLQLSAGRIASERSTPATSQPTESPPSPSPRHENLPAKPDNIRIPGITEERLRAFFDRAPVAAWIVDDSCKYVYANSYYCGLFGTSPERILGKTAADAHPPEIAVSRHAGNRALWESGQSSETVETYRATDGRERKIHVVKFPVSASSEAGAGAGFIGGLALDITELYGIQRGLEEAKRTADAASQAKSDFLAMMSHEIRTPLTIILGYANILSDPTVSHSQFLEFLRAIQRCGNHLLQMINDTLDLSKIESGNMELESTVISPREPMEYILKLFQAQCAEKRIGLTGAAIGPLPDVIVTDPMRLRQILLNLAGNAVKFTSTGTVAVTVRVVRRPPDAIESNHSFIIYEVKDQGPGIPLEKIQNIFDPFKQANANVNRNHGGTGLGLALSQRFAQLLGGEITVESELGKGSRFALRLPIPAGDPDDPATLPESDPVIGVTGVPAATPIVPPSSDELPQRKRILVAEDTVDIQQMLNYYLHCIDPQAECHFADNGRDALSLMRKNRYDLVLMDIQMPEMDGVSAAKQARAEGCQTPIIALTANVLVGEREHYLSEGFTDYLGKPVDFARFTQALGRYLSADPEVILGAVTPRLRIIRDHLPEAFPCEQNVVSAHDPEFSNLQAQFRKDLPGIAREITNLSQSHNLPALKNRLNQLHRSATLFAYPGLSEIAQQLESQCLDSHAAPDSFHALCVLLIGMIKDIAAITHFPKTPET